MVEAYGKRNYGTHAQPRPVRKVANGWEIVCKYCGETAIKKSSRAEFCCDEHRYAWHAEHSGTDVDAIRKQRSRGQTPTRIGVRS